MNWHTHVKKLFPSLFIRNQCFLSLKKLEISFDISFLLPFFSAAKMMKTTSFEYKVVQ